MAKVYGSPVADCPTCSTPIGDKHPYGWCAKCGTPLPEEILAKLPVGEGRSPSSTIGASAASTASFSALSAYAGVVAGVGWIVIIIGALAFAYGLLGVEGNLLLRLVAAAPSLIVGILGLGLVAAGQLMECFVAIQRDTAYIARSMRESKNAG